MQLIMAKIPLTTNIGNTKGKNSHAVMCAKCSVKLHNIKSGKSLQQVDV